MRTYMCALIMLYYTMHVSACEGLWVLSYMCIKEGKTM